MGVLDGCKEAFFNNVFSGFLWAVLGLFQLFRYVLGVSFVVDVSSGCVSVLGASVLCCCGGFWGTGK